MNKIIVFLSVVLAMVIAGGLFWGRHFQRLSRQLHSREQSWLRDRDELSSLQGIVHKLEAGQAELKQKLNTIRQEARGMGDKTRSVRIDRDNLSARLSRAKEDVSRFERMRVALQEKEKLLEAIEQSRDDVQGRKDELEDELGALRLALEQSRMASEQARLEKEQALGTLKKMRKASGVQELDEHNQSLRRRIEKLTTALQQARQKMEKERSRETVLREEIASLRDAVERTKEDYARVRRKNKVFEAKLVNAPVRLSEITRKNKVLIQQSANMHHNMGMFYLKNKEYERAIAEFERAVELRPEDASSHFNIGYIYAEHLLDSKKAVKHFERYLKCVNRQGPDIDWVREYILTWQPAAGSER